MTQQMQAHTFRLRRFGAILLGRFATVLLLAITAAGLPGCGDGADPTAPGEPTPGEPAPPPAAPDLRFEPSALDLAPGDSARTTVRVEPAADLRGATFTIDGTPPGLSTRFEAAADGASGTLTLVASPDAGALAESLMVTGRKGDGSKTWVGSLTLTASGTTARTFFVDPVNGSDANQGTQTKPFKTLTKALTKARAGDTVTLAKGSYSKQGSGDTFPVLVPAGVTIVGTLQSNGGKGTFLSASSSAAGETGLTFAGDATVKDLELDVFGTAIFADKGKLTLSNLNLILNRQGVGLGGSAQATMINANVFISDGQTAVAANQQAQFTMDGGQITGDGSNCGKGAVGLRLRDAAQARLTNTHGLRNALRNIPGRALAMGATSKATVNLTTISRTFPDGCFPGFGAVEVRESASLALTNSLIQGIGGSNAVGIDAVTTMPLTLDATTVDGFSGTGILMQDPGKAVQLVLTDASNVLRNTIGIDARGANVRVEISGGVLSGTNGTILAANIKIRRSSVLGGNIGLGLTGMNADLGTVTDPGGNTIRVNPANTVGSGLRIANNLSGLVVKAVGNTWAPNVQGADSQGHYIPGTQVNSSSPLAKGPNFDLSTGTTIQF
jgi:hypothetical protein